MPYESTAVEQRSEDSRSNDDRKTQILESYRFSELTPEAQSYLNSELNELFEEMSTNDRTAQLSPDKRWDLAESALQVKVAEQVEGQDKSLDQQQSESRRVGLSV